jgi:hypothetical protein
MSGFFGGKSSMPDPIPYVPPPTPVDPAIAAKAKAEEELLRKKRGRAGTIMTGAAGDQSTPETQKALLLGQ